MTPTLPQLIAELKASGTKENCLGYSPDKPAHSDVPPWTPKEIAELCDGTVDDTNIVFLRHFQNCIDLFPHLIALVEKQAEELDRWRNMPHLDHVRSTYWADPIGDVDHIEELDKEGRATDLATQSLLAAWQGVKEKV